MVYKKNNSRKGCTDAMGYNYIMGIVILIIWITMACLLLLCSPTPQSMSPIIPVPATIAITKTFLQRLDEEAVRRNNHIPTRCANRVCPRKCLKLCGGDMTCRTDCLGKCYSKCHFVCQSWFRWLLSVVAFIITAVLLTLYFYWNYSNEVCLPKKKGCY